MRAGKTVDDFTELTEIGRARRLRPLAMAALEQYDLGVARVQLITNSWNCVFRVDATDGGRYVLRVTLPRPERRDGIVESEAAFMAAIAGGTDVPVPVPIPNRDGELVTTAAADRVPEPRDCVLFSWVRGGALADRASHDTYRRLGEISATMHRFAESWTPPPWFDIVTYDETIHMGEPNVLFGERAVAHMTPEHRRALPDLLAQLDANVARVHHRGPVIVTHGDLHHWNVMIDRNRLTVIDFEDLQWAAPLLDVATTLYYVRWQGEYDELLDGFREGYSEVRPWVEAFDGELDSVIAARGVDLLNVCFDDPELDMDLTEFSARVISRTQDLLP